jgi:hypothetical protein
MAIVVLTVVTLNVGSAHNAIASKGCHEPCFPMRRGYERERSEFESTKVRNASTRRRTRYPNVPLAPAFQLGTTDATNGNGHCSIISSNSRSIDNESDDKYREAFVANCSSFVPTPRIHSVAPFRSIERCVKLLRCTNTVPPSVFPVYQPACCGGIQSLYLATQAPCGYSRLAPHHHDQRQNRTNPSSGRHGILAILRPAPNVGQDLHQ